jgi:NitT/TauT family transport system permease protein
MISPLAWMPIALLIFASFESAIHFLVTVATVWPIILNTVAGVSRVNSQWINMARDQGAKDHHLMLHIVIPASVPYILTSLRLALGVAWIVLVPAEFLGVSSGLGYLINDARDTMEYDRLMAVVVAIGILGFLLDGAIQLTLRRLKWNWVS